ncbi:alpha-amylase family glycosyl hydrolase [Photobacterium kasasachensis]|uniref:alpha-amylase family glycosyl hydrolase n=1 Tax=Photobacterium kasasachensis TaxID=2910240 RepID=UPI003D0CCBF3
MAFAIVSTIADEKEQVDYFIRYHLSIGFERLYLYFDEPGDPAIDVARSYPQVDVTVCDVNWRKQCIESLACRSDSESGLYEDEVMIRQEANVHLTIERARKEKVSWLLHIDSDELFYTSSADIKTHFSELDVKGIKNVIYKNSEALIHANAAGEPFQSTKYFKRNFFKNNNWTYSATQRKLLRSMGLKAEFYFHFYQNGKSAVKLDQDVDVDGVHFFSTKVKPIVWEQGCERVLHFPCPTYSSFEKKYRKLGDFSNDWRGEPRAGDFISLIHLQARDAFLSGKPGALKDLYLKKVAVDDAGNIEKLLSCGLLDCIENLHLKVRSKAEITDRILSRKTPLYEKCLALIEKEHQAEIYSLSTLRHQFSVIFERLDKVIRLTYPDDKVSDNVILASLKLVVQAINRRNPNFRKLDEERVSAGDWLSTNERVGACFYIDRFADNIEGLRSKLSYLRDLGINYLYLMPPFEGHPDKNDGGFAITNYRSISNILGGNEEFEQLVVMLKEYDIALCLDFVLNHTATSHPWAVKAADNDPYYQGFYWFFETESEVSQWLTGVEDTFPEQGKNISYNSELERYVWTTFNDYQWDLNYSNPDVFVAMLDNLLYLINLGADVLRLDAIPHIWKEIDSNCKNLPECQLIVEAYQLCASMLSPSVKLISEAIVAPEQVKSYVSSNGTSFAYRPLLSASLWQSIMSTETSVLQHQLRRWSTLPHHCDWINYVNCHDDVQWVFSNKSLIEQTPDIDIKLFYRSLLSFYASDSGKSFPRGLLFQKNRISGTTASLAGLEKAIDSNNKVGIEKSINRILLMHSVILSIGGLPIIYIGDEVAELNDYSYRDNENTAYDSRWVHRAKRNWKDISNSLLSQGSIAERVHCEITKLVFARKRLPELSGNRFNFIPSKEKSLLIYTREDESYQFLFIGNFSPLTKKLSLQGANRKIELYKWENVVGESVEEMKIPREIKPYQYFWLRRKSYINGEL